MYNLAVSELLQEKAILKLQPDFGHTLLLNELLSCFSNRWKSQEIILDLIWTQNIEQHISVKIQALIFTIGIGTQCTQMMQIEISLTKTEEANYFIICINRFQRGFFYYSLNYILKKIMHFIRRKKYFCITVVVIKNISKKLVCSCSQI